MAYEESRVERAAPEFQFMAILEKKMHLMFYIENMGTSNKDLNRDDGGRRNGLLFAVGSTPWAATIR